MVTVRLGTVLSNGICCQLASSPHPLPATLGLVPTAVKNHMWSPANRVQASLGVGPQGQSSVLSQREEGGKDGYGIAKSCQCSASRWLGWVMRVDFSLFLPVSVCSRAWEATLQAGGIDAAQTHLKQTQNRSLLMRVEVQPR